MAWETLSMRKSLEVLRLSPEQKLSVRKVARSCCLARTQGQLIPSGVRHGGPAAGSM
jgi:hypothetical protein